MKKILIYGLTDMAGGVESFIRNYLSHMDRSELDIHLICYDKKPAYYNELLALGGTIHVIPGRRAAPIKNFDATIRLFRKYRFDTLWFNSCSLSDILPLWMARIYGVKQIIIHSHNSDFMAGRLNKVLHSIGRPLAVHLATDLWACSDLAANFMFPTKILKEHRYRMINNAIQPKRFTFNNMTRLTVRKNLRLNDQLVIGHIGRMHDQKNHRFVIDIFHKIHKTHPRSTLLLVGSGELEAEIRRQADSLGLSSSILFLGIRDDIPDLLQAMDIFLLPSFYEGLPIVGIEAQASGLQCFFANTITPNLKVTSNAHFLPLTKPPSYWARKILQSTKVTREDKSAEITAAGFNLVNEAIKVQQFITNENKDIL